MDREPFYRSRNFAIFVAVAALIFLACAVWGALGIPAALATGFMYLVGSQWVYGFIDKRAMYAPYTGTELSYEPNDPGRIGLFILGVFAMVLALISVAGVFRGS